MLAPVISAFFPESCRSIEFSRVLVRRQRAGSDIASAGGSA
jgi:hypothetical protein